MSLDTKYNTANQKSQDTTTKDTDYTEPDHYQQKNLIKAISLIFTEIIKENKEILAKSKNKSQELKHIAYFNSSTGSRPYITIESYLHRIVKHTRIEESTLIISLILLDRICEVNKIYLTDLNIHR